MLADVSLDLPVRPVLPDLVAALRERGAGVLVAPPGTGKTTTAPLAVADAVAGRVVIAQPRRVAARAAAHRMAALLGERVGDRIGYAVRGERRGRTAYPGGGGHHRPACSPAAPRPGAARGRRGPARRVPRTAARRRPGVGVQRGGPGHPAPGPLAARDVGDPAGRPVRRAARRGQPRARRTGRGRPASGRAGVGAAAAPGRPAGRRPGGPGAAGPRGRHGPPGTARTRR